MYVTYILLVRLIAPAIIALFYFDFHIPGCERHLINYTVYTYLYLRLSIQFVYILQNRLSSSVYYRARTFDVLSVAFLEGECRASSSARARCESVMGFQECIPATIQLAIYIQCCKHFGVVLCVYVNAYFGSRLSCYGKAVSFIGSTVIFSSPRIEVLM